MPRRTGGRRRAAALILALALLLPARARPAGATHVVAIDPGHGGRGEEPGPFSGDSWDPAKRAFQNPFNYGAVHDASGQHEHRIVLAIAARVRDLLARAATDEGFARFRTLLSAYGKPRGGGKFPRPDWKIVMLREDSFESPQKANLREVNRFYRLYDGPTGFRDDDRPHPDLYPGRMSLVNRAKPELCVSIHINSSKDAKRRGQAAVVTPNGRLFGFLRDLARERGEREANALLARLDWFFDRTPILSSLQGLAKDSATYFDEGGGTPRRDRVAWRYRKDDKAFAERERGAMESYRRGGGASLGGDNLAASDELLRFVRAALLRAIAAGEPARAAGAQADELVGPHGLPFARDYAVPLFVNAVSAYLELGYMSNAEDRRLLARHEAAYAEGIAVGIYALLYGMVPHESAPGGVAGFVPPAGAPLDLRKYRRGRDYFTEVFPKKCEIPERVLAFRETFEVLPSAKVRAGDAPPAAIREAAEPRPPRATGAGAAPAKEAPKAKSAPKKKAPAKRKAPPKKKAPANRPAPEKK